MPEELDPPRKFYGFKPTTFEVANQGIVPAPTATSGAATPAPDPGIVRSDEKQIDVRELNRIAATGLPPLKSSPVPVPENEVHTILRDNLAVANAAGLNDVVIDPRHRTPRQRRLRAFWLWLALINIPLGTIAWIASHPLNESTIVLFTSAIAALGVCNGRLVWHTFFLNTD